jgi:hypothetical protein
MTDRLIDYAVNQLDPDDRAAVEELVRTDPTAADKLTRLVAALAPLDVDLTPDDPPPGLAVAAIGRVAEYAVANGLFTAADGFAEPGPVAVPRSMERPAEPRRVRFELSRTHVNVAVAAAVAFLTVGLGIVAVQNARLRARTLACQNNLRELHASLAGYSDTHGGRFPQAGTDAVPLAGAYLDELARNGQPVSAAARACPLAPPTTPGYAYSLGFHDPFGTLTGLRKPDSADDYTPILADLPTDSPTPAGHRGWNVLAVGGSVRYTTVTTIGIDGDDIFRNAAGARRAGLHRDDTCLGHPFDRP